MDYSKILRLINLFSSENCEEKYEFFFSLFDSNSDGKIEKEELNEFLFIFFDFLTQTNFEDNSELEKDKTFFKQNKERDIANAIKEIAYDINSKYSGKEGYLSFEEWKEWMRVS